MLISSTRFELRILIVACVGAMLLFALGCIERVEEVAETTPTEPLTYSADDSILTVPTGDGRPVMTDGIYQPGEWDDAASLVINDSVTIKFKQYRDHLYLALDSRSLLSPMIDVYFCSDSTEIIQLHVSAQLGERKYLVGDLPDDNAGWVWGATTAWYANEFRWRYRMQDSLTRQVGMDWASAIQFSSFPHEAIEMDILRSKIGDGDCFVRFGVSTARMSEGAEFHPAETSTANLDGWLKLQF